MTHATAKVLQEKWISNQQSAGVHHSVLHLQGNYSDV